MKKSLYVDAKCVFIFTFLLYCVSGIAQSVQNNKITNGTASVELTVVKSSDAPYTDLVHIYVLKIENLTGQPVSFRLKAENTTCEKKNTVDLIQEVYTGEQNLAGSATNVSATNVIPAHGFMEYSIRLVRPSNTPLNTWNCTEVRVLDSDDKVLSNTIVIESFIPDPKDFR